MGMPKNKPPLSKERFERTYQYGGWIEVFKEEGILFNTSIKTLDKIFNKLKHYLIQRKNKL